MIKRCRSRQKSGQFKRKSETKTSIRCGNSAAEEFDVKQKFAPTLSQVLCSLLDRAYADNLEVERTLAQIKSHFY
ncbi:hypothetical protein T4B_5366 [Trichinella pseudospiralis]|uniref:Uncharacterized protein n=1 Tax=Trichinella pseudospiralis TaxID=6337 RepID=A0A0V1JAD9_TRIPS|nr:hypothetical protein T4B_5366 [Trichinella pseudospiralis]KRZ44558.1 hypothetical protein T4C_12522 [Trichinella pseudospiralis]